MHELFNFSIVIRKIFTNTTRTLNISYLFLHACIKIRITIQRTCPHAYRLFLLSNPESIKSFFFFLPNEQREFQVVSNRKKFHVPSDNYDTTRSNDGR